jgi:hypothetical protein
MSSAFLKLKHKLFVTHLKLLALFLSEETLYRIAVHEIGHAYFMLNAKDYTVEAYIEGTGGWTRSHGQQPSVLDHSFTWNALKSIQAGMAAEQLIFGNFGYVCASGDRDLTQKLLIKNVEMTNTWVNIFNTKNIKLSPAWDTFDMNNDYKKVAEVALQQSYLELEKIKPKLINAAKRLLKEKYLDEKTLREYF